MEERNINEVYEKMLGLIGAWKVTTVEMDDEHKEMHVHVEYKNKYGYHHCPICGCPSKLHDHRLRQIRHLDTCDYKTFIDIHLPRVHFMNSSRRKFRLQMGAHITLKHLRIMLSKPCMIHQ
jgi:transposase